MQWQEQGIIISSRKHGERSAIVSLLTREHGRHLGVVRNGQTKTQKATCQVGAIVEATWQARLEGHMGSYTFEILQNPLAHLLDEPESLSVLQSACALCEIGFAERDPHPKAYQALQALIEALLHKMDLSFYVKFEVVLLQELGFGLSLDKCVATGEKENLLYVSPRSASAVSEAAGEPYKERLLPLPEFLLNEAAPVNLKQIVAGLRLTGYFLEKCLSAQRGIETRLPQARQNLFRQLKVA